MPDHGHEGSLDFPASYEASEWPSAANGYQPIPEVVAYGNTKKTPFGGNLGFKGLRDPYLQPGRIDLISAYDGHQAGVGRIVAHTSFHHFVNVNLNGFLNPDDGSPNGALQSISEYYRNLASWLMPPAQRTKTLHGMMRWLPSVMRDLSGAPLELLGTAALKGLGHYATGGQIQDLIFHAVEQVIPPTHERRTEQLPLPRLAYLLGGMVTESQRNPNQNVIVNGIRRALRTRLQELEAGAEAMRDLLGGEREPRECKSEPWSHPGDDDLVVRHLLPDALCGGGRFDLVQGRAGRRTPQVVVAVRVHPELGRHPEILAGFYKRGCAS